MAKDLVAKVGTYTKDGQEKGEYVKVGVILSGENGEFALLDPTVNLAGVMIKQRMLNPKKANDKVMVSIFDRDQQNNAPSRPKQAQDQGAYDDFANDTPKTGDRNAVSPPVSTGGAYDDFANDTPKTGDRNAVSPPVSTGGAYDDFANDTPF